MTRRVTVVCDNTKCGKVVTWGYYTVEYNQLQTPSYVPAVYNVPQEQATFCSLECLVYTNRWYVTKFERENPPVDSSE